MYSCRFIDHQHELVQGPKVASSNVYLEELDKDTWHEHAREDQAEV